MNIILSSDYTVISTIEVIVINHASSLLMKYKLDARGREAHEGKVYISLINYSHVL